MKNQYRSLLSPGSIGALKLKNRIVMAPMGSNLSNPDGTLNERIINYYEARAKGGAGMVVMGSVSISWPIGSANICQVAISDDRYIPGFIEIVERVHRHGARIALQLQHAGVTALNDIAQGYPLLVPSIPDERQSDIGPTLTEEEAAAMARPYMQKTSRRHYREATADDLAWVCSQFADAVERARKAGIDGVEIHAAHGYLISNFLSPSTNYRTDNYGGCIENRARLLVDVIKTVRQRVGQDYPVWIRLDGTEFRKPEGITQQDAITAARLAEKAGVDAINVSTYASPNYGIGYTEAHATHIPEYFVPYATSIKRAVNIPVLTAGRIEPEIADQLIRKKQIDFVCMGRKLLADPELPAKLASDNSDTIRPCVYCYTCISQIFINKSVRCVVNAAASFEGEVTIVPVKNPRRILVIGGGPSGMEVARVSALRGHQVTLCERNNALGGSVRLSAVSYPVNGQLVRYFENILAGLPVEIQLKTTVNEEFVRELNPDVVVVATGARWTVSDIPGANLPHVLDGESFRALLGSIDGPLPQKLLLTERWAIRIARWLRVTRSPKLLEFGSHVWMPLGKNVVIYGGGIVGIELAEFLALRGRKVTVLEPSTVIASQMMLLRRWRALYECQRLGVNLITKVTSPRIEIDAVYYVTSRGQERGISADNVILATGATENTIFTDRLHNLGFDVRSVGDCSNIGYIEGAIRNGNKIAREI